MTKYKKNGNTVDAYQHQPNPNNETVGYPQWFLDLIVNEQIRPMPDGSLHLTLDDGSIAPLPIGYWLIRDMAGATDENNPQLYIVAPDVFAAQYSEV